MSDQSRTETGTDPEATLGAVPIDDDTDRPTFEAPWQARAFGVAVALCEREAFDLTTFQSRFAERIDDLDPESMRGDVERTYYEQWLECLEAVLVDAGVVEEDELATRATEFSEGDRDAAEFVVSDSIPNPNANQSSRRQ